ncbi:MAG: AI-2E family transporter, partial [Pseudomonadota bacterium]
DVELTVDVSNELQALQLEGLLRGVFDIVTNTAGDISVVLLFVLFLMLDQRYFDAKIRALFPKDGRADRVEQVLADIGRDTRLYVWIMTVVSLAVGLSTYVICSYFGLKGAAFWGFLAFALNYIPTIGTFVGVVLPALFGLVQFDNYADMLGMIGALAVVQFFLGNILLPRMTGEQLNLSEFVVILSLLVWGAMWGIAGMFLAVPLMMVLAIVLAQFESTRPVAILLSKTGKIGSPR